MVVGFWLSTIGNSVSLDLQYQCLSDEAAWVTGLELTIDGGDSLFIDSPIRRGFLA
ncbi:MAG: hypothetical protein OXD49_03695 [Candidatus Poribacteria bacterium]|nr:hypothetical protein [Candidatus Poribacteria bacterium]